MAQITIHDKRFNTFLSSATIATQISRIAKEINLDYKKKRPLFIAILNGSFMFAADLMKKVTLNSEKVGK